MTAAPDSRPTPRRPSPPLPGPAAAGRAASPIATARALRAQQGSLLAVLFGPYPLILSVLFTSIVLMFLLIEPTPRWLVPFGAIIAAIGTDGVLRALRREPFESGTDSLPFLLLPTLYAVAVPVFAEDTVSGYWAPLAALVSGIGFSAILVAEVASVRENDHSTAAARFLASAGTYFVAFALFSLTYSFDLGLRESIIAVVLVSVLLATELLRDGEIEQLETLTFSIIVGAVVAEARWVLHYVPLDGYLAGLVLLLTFYFVTGVVHAYITRHLDRTVLLEYGFVAAAGLALVITARTMGIA